MVTPSICDSTDDDASSPTDMLSSPAPPAPPAPLPQIGSQLSLSAASKGTGSPASGFVTSRLRRSRAVCFTGSYRDAGEYDEFPPPPPKHAKTRRADDASSLTDILSPASPFPILPEATVVTENMDTASDNGSVEFSTSDDEADIEDSDSESHSGSTSYTDSGTDAAISSSSDDESDDW